MSKPEMKKTRYPGIYERNGRYTIVWYHRKRQHRKSYRTLALAREAKGQKQKQGGDRRPESREHFGDYFDRWIGTYTGRTARGFSESTRVEYRRSIDTFAVPVWETWKLSDIEPRDVRDLFKAMRRKNASTSQIRKLRVALSALFATAVEDDAVTTNPAHGTRIPPPAVPEPESTRVKALTREELDLLLAALPEEWKLTFKFLAETGLRVSELIGLRWKHLDLTATQPIVKVREQFYRGERKALKTANARRDLPIDPETADRLLARRRDTYRGEDAPVFASKTGTELHPPNLRRRVLDPTAISLGHYVEVTGADGKAYQRSTVGFHTFRHTCGSILFDKGRNATQVSKWLGHAKPSFTHDTYIHLVDDGIGGPLSLGQGDNARTIRGAQTTANPDTASDPVSVVESQNGD